MKKIFSIVLLVFLLTGCTEDLVPVDYSEINPSIFPQSEADVQAMVNAAYYPLRGGWSNGIHGLNERGLIFIDATTEILHGKYAVQQKLSLHNYSPIDTDVTYFYDNFYNKISMMTLMIDMIGEASVNEAVKEKAIAEIRCARGLLSYELFDLYGPLVIAPFRYTLR